MSENSSANGGGAEARGPRNLSLRIRSGGQTGVDRSALRVATQLELTYCGWCPKQGWAEDLPQPPGIVRLYPALSPTPSSDPRQRTAWNVRDSDATLICVPSRKAEISAGTSFAKICADLVFAKPWRLVELDNDEPGPEIIAAWISALARQRSSALDLNIAGPRESESPGIEARAMTYLRRLFAACSRTRSL